MHYRPTFEEFAALADGAALVPVYRRLTGDTLTPVSAFRKVQVEGPAFLFESVVGGERHGRYSFLGSDPLLTVTAQGLRVTTRDHGAGTSFTEDHADPLRFLEDLLKKYHAPRVPGLPRFSGGAVGYVAYDAVRYIEHLPDVPEDDRGLPDLCFGLYDRMVIFDHAFKTICVVGHARIGGDLRSAYDEACRKVDRTVERLQRGVADLQLTDICGGAGPRKPYTSNFAPGGYQDAVRRCQEYIKAGDAFQVVPSQRLTVETNARPFDIYRALRVVNPSPFMFYLVTDDAVLIGASPEILVRVEDGVVTVRPLAGTRRRGVTDEEDERLADELLADPKERAEHVMLVDLGRNDVGRVARYGSVELDDLLTVERYSHVMHLSSTVTGRLRPGLTAFDALRAALPAGTLSGAPKVRAMQIIDELEPHKRGPYGGGVGYIDFGGNMDTCIALRTLVVQGQTAYLQAGAGVVMDSDPEEEYQETINKAMGLLRAVEVAEQEL